jgi:hypothetical protein
VTTSTPRTPRKTGGGLDRIVVAAIGCALLGTFVAGCSSTSTPAVQAERISLSRMLDVGDLGAGWTAVAPGAAQACGAPPSTAALVGPDGRRMAYAQAGGAAEVVEYAVASSAVATTYVHAVQQIEDAHSCSASGGGQTASSTFQQVLPLPRHGDDSVGMLVSEDVDGTTSQVGYSLVRQGPDTVIVRYSNAGPLDQTALAQVTGVALHRLVG